MTVRQSNSQYDDFAQSTKPNDPLPTTNSLTVQNRIIANSRHNEAQALLSPPYAETSSSCCVPVCHVRTRYGKPTVLTGQRITPVAVP